MLDLEVMYMWHLTSRLSIKKKKYKSITVFLFLDCLLAILIHEWAFTKKKKRKDFYEVAAE